MTSLILTSAIFLYNYMNTNEQNLEHSQNPKKSPGIKANITYVQRI